MLRVAKRRRREPSLLPSVRAQGVLQYYIDDHNAGEPLSGELEPRVMAELGKIVVRSKLRGDGKTLDYRYFVGGLRYPSKPQAADALHALVNGQPLPEPRGGGIGKKRQRASHEDEIDLTEEPAAAAAAATPATPSQEAAGTSAAAAGTSAAAAAGTSAAAAGTSAAAAGTSAAAAAAGTSAAAAAPTPEDATQAAITALRLGKVGWAGLRAGLGGAG